MSSGSASLLSADDSSSLSSSTTGRTTLQIPLEINANNLQQPATDARAESAEDLLQPEAVDAEVLEEAVEVALASAESLRADTEDTSQEAVEETMEEIAAQQPEAPPEEQQLQLSSFEADLMSQPRANFTIQLLGSRSEENVENFLDSNSRPGMGYFQTVYQQQPWFVVILGSFDNRASGLETIRTLPQSLRSLEPWLRSMADIQAEIRDLRSP